MKHSNPTYKILHINILYNQQKNFFIHKEEIIIQNSYSIENKLYLCGQTNIFKTMTEKLKEIKNLIAEGSTEHAIDQLNQLINLNPEYAAEAYYLLGNAFRKKGDWQGALNNYQEAIALNPDSPAAEARNMVMDILNFYNKDMFNQ